MTQLNTKRSSREVGELHFEHCEPYTMFAHCYDRVMEKVDYRAWACGIDRLLRNSGVTGNRLLDLACGTGRLSLHLADLGWEVSGSDCSQPMLQQAQRAAAAVGRELPLSQQDMRFFDLKKHPEQQPFDAVCCLHDGLNYLTEKFELAALFDRVAAALKPAGIWLFDYSTRWNIRKNFAGRQFIEEGEDFALLWDNLYHRYSGRLEVVLEMVEFGDGQSLPGREIHLQRAFPLRTVRRLLTKSSSFKLLGCYDGYTEKKVHRRSVEAVFVARKSSDQV